MLKSLLKNFKGVILVNGPTNSGKSKLAEFLIKEQDSITYIATSMPRENDPEWQRRINIHRNRRPNSWKLIEHPLDIIKAIESLDKKESILLDSLGGLVEQHLSDNDDQWQLFQNKLVKCIENNVFGIIIVVEEIGWGIVPATPIGHLFRERLTNISLLLGRNASNQWLAINGIAIDLGKVGDFIP